MNVRRPRLAALAAALPALLAPASALACEPPFTAWFVNSSFPADGAAAAPINGVIALDLQFIDSFNSSQWPSEEVFTQTVQLDVLRGGTEPVPGMWIYEPTWRRALFMADRVFAEGVTYTVEITLLNSQLGPIGIPDEDLSLTFTTGSELDEVAPAFSGLQSFTLTEAEQAVQECCTPPEDWCLGSCPPCLWCWTVDWTYRPKAQLSFRPVEDEFGRETIAYAVHRVPDAFTLPATDAEPLSVVKDVRNDEIRLEYLLDEDDPGPWCYFIRAHDLFGRTDANDHVLCRTRDELVPVTRSPIPPPDRSQCAEDLPDAGTDPTDDTDDPQPDIGPDQDTSHDAQHDTEPDSPDDEGPVMPNVTTGDTGDDCDCSSVARHSPPTWPWMLLLGATAAIVLHRRR